MIRIFKVTTNQREIWRGAAASFDAAADVACRVFKCPLRSILSVEVERVVDC